MRVHFIDVGQGDATLLEFACGLVLVDTGGEKNEDLDGVDRVISTVDRVLAERPDLESRLDALVLTHPHIDHTRGVDRVLERYWPKNVVVNGRTRGSGRRQQQRALEYARSAGARSWIAELSAIGPEGATNEMIDPVACEPIDPIITVLWGAVHDGVGLSDSSSKNGNNHSVVLRVSLGHASLLLTGDLETSAIELLVERYDPSGLLDVDVYQVGHHGSDNGTTEPLLRAMSPDLAVISMGSADRQRPWTAWAYGHPRRSLITRLEQWLSQSRATTSRPIASAPKTFEPYAVKKAIYATAWDGTVTLTASSDGTWRVEPPQTGRGRAMRSPADAALARSH